MIVSALHNFARRHRVLLPVILLLAFFAGGCIGHALAHNGPCLVAPAPHLDSATVENSPWGVQRRMLSGEPVDVGGLSSLLWQDGLDEPSDFELDAFIRERNSNWSGFLRAVGLGGTNFKMLALMPVFPDAAYITPPEFFDSLLFGPVWGTAAHYWEVQSGGQLRIGTEDYPSAIGYVPMDSSYSYYVNNNYGFGGYPRNSQRLVEDLVRIANERFDIDFSEYDNDLNGRVDGLTVIHPGSGAEWTGLTLDIWSHKWQVRNNVLLDGVLVTVFSIQPEYWSTVYKMTMGVYGHEWGHVFGLPDQYDVDGSSQGLGKFCGMSGGSWNGGPGERLGQSPAGLCAWCRVKLGFEDVTILEAGDMAFIEGEVYRFSVGAGGVTGSHYYLLEMRTKTGYGVGLPEAGLYIWRCDDTKNGNNSKEWHPAKTTLGNYTVALLQATPDIPPGNGYMLERDVSAGAAHMIYPSEPYGTRPGVDSIGPETVPSTDWYDGTRTNLALKNITQYPDSVTAFVSVGGCYCAVAGDMDGDGAVTWGDLLPDPNNPMKPTVFGHIFYGAPVMQYPDCPLPTGDADCDGEMTATDGAFLIDLVAFGKPLPCSDQCVAAN